MSQCLCNEQHRCYSLLACDLGSIVAMGPCGAQGEALGCGAHLVALRREAIGEQRVGAAWHLPDLVAAIDLQRRARRMPPVPGPSLSLTLGARAESAA